MTTQKSFFTLICSIFSILMFSQNQNYRNYEVLIKQLQIPQSEIADNFVTNKILPYDKSKEVWVLPRFIKKYHEEGFDIYDVYIAVVNSSNGKILNLIRDKELWTSDAIELSSVSIDTGLYKLNEDTRAFGVRANFHNRSQSNPFSEEILNLYIPEKKILKNILKNLSVNQNSGEWDTHCAGEFNQDQTIIDIDTSKTNSFNNILLKIKQTVVVSYSSNGDCKERKSTKESIKVLKYNGNTYQ